MGKRTKKLSRRRFIERAGIGLGALAGAGACVEGDGSGGNPVDGQPRPPSGPQAGSPTPQMGGPDPQATRPPQMPDPGPLAGPGDPPAPAMPAPTSEPMAGPSPAAADAGIGPSLGEPSTVPVGIVKGSDIPMMVARAVALAGGLDAIMPGQTVFIKPNAVSTRAVGTPGIRTSNEVLAAVVQLVKQRDPGRIIVGDRSARGFDSGEVFESSGMAAAAMMAGADEIYAAPASGNGEDDHWQLVQTPLYEEVWAPAGGLLVMRKMVEADHVINVPACKNHRFALYSLAAKNFVGGIGDSSRDPLHYFSLTDDSFALLGRDIALLNQAFAPLMNILDATTILVNGGPGGDGSDAVRAQGDIIAASKDRVALDTLGLCLIKHELSRTPVSAPDPSNARLISDRVWSFPQIVNSIELGIDTVKSASDASLEFEGVSDDDALSLEGLWRA